MQEGLRIGLIVALGTGAVFAVVTAFEGFIGKVVGPVNASLLEHVISGGLSLVLLALVATRGNVDWGAAKNILPQISVVGLLVIIGVVGIAFSIPRTGVAVGNFAMVFAQISVAVLIDYFGFLGAERIPLSFPRIFGIGLMALGLYFVFPRS